MIMGVGAIFRYQPAPLVLQLQPGKGHHVFFGFADVQLQVRAAGVKEQEAGDGWDVQLWTLRSVGRQRRCGW